MPKIKFEVDELERKMNAPDFWDNQENAKKILKQTSALKDKWEKVNGLESKLEDIGLLIELIEESEDKDLEEDLRTSMNELEKAIEAFNLETLLSGEYDGNDVIFSIHPGAGGTESHDWAEMLLRMYLRWAEKKSFKVKTLDYQLGDEAGIKSVTLSIEGNNAYGYLKSEKGVHRLVRISPFDASGRRHTSFASVDITPQIEEDTSIEINADDLRIDTYRSSGAGGQHVNKTESAIRITHIPTGVVVQCQNERSQIQNRETAMKMLVSKLVEIKEREHKEKIEDIQGEYGQIAWGNQIRSYVFHPYSMVKDHRTNAETGNVQAVMDGDLDLFINEYLKKSALED